MNILCWNCRGLGNPRAVRMLRHWSHVYSLDLLFVSETMISAFVAENLKTKLGFNCAIGVDSEGNSGGLCVFWKGEKVCFDLVSFCKHHICGNVTFASGLVWKFVGVYGWAEASQKSKTWELMRSVNNDNGPCIFGGDFNEVLSSSELEGVVDVEREAMLGFRAVMDDLLLRDLGFTGSWYTWERGSDPRTRKRERLDRFVANPYWCRSFERANVVHLARFKSDHTPILLRMGGYPITRQQRKRPIRFETAWLLDPDCDKKVGEAWSMAGEKGLSDRVKAVAASLASWVGRSMGIWGRILKKWSNV